MPSPAPATHRNCPPRVHFPAPKVFARVFAVGHPDRTQAVDACGVALSAIQGLYGELRQLDRELARLRRELRRLKT